MLLLLGGAVACFVIFSNSPEKDAQTASVKLFDTLSAILSPEATPTVENKNIKIDGKVDVVTKSQYSSQTMNVGANFTLEANDNADARVSVDLDLKDVLADYSDEVPPVNIEAKELYSKNNYFKISGISDILSEVLDSFGSFGSEIIPIIDDIDGKWLELDLDKITEENSKKTAEQYSDLFSQIGYDYEEAQKQSKCLADEVTFDKITALIDPNDLADALSLVVYEGKDKKTENGTVYTLKIDADGTAKLFNNYYKKYQEKIKEIAEKCNLGDSYKSLYENGREIKAEDLEEYIDKIPEIFVTIKNKEITGISTVYSNESIEVSVNLNLSYPKALEIEEPKDAKPVSELVDEISSIIQGTFSYGGGTYTYPNDCLTEDGSCSASGGDSTPLDPKVKTCLKKLGYEIDTYEDFYANSDAYSAWATSDSDC